MRIDPQQSWHPVYLLQPFYNLSSPPSSSGASPPRPRLRGDRKGEKSKEQVQRELKGIAGKAQSQVVKDYVAWPLISGLAAAGGSTGTSSS